ncbi:hypothetical protein [Hymenobacter ruricola]|uniref:Uncharacterized protein n=1 Tax=Hymenobacter ruricola TaxID=2791023 RepID=A0ABS0I1Y1_9BACT|nr:hypothetical protein [Hymenobacter ruricola]MBF9220912.1 hypothetical protein [Hymenobacter ruricola]
MAQPKYAARFENFFLNLRLNRDQFADMAAFTLQALEQDDNDAFAAPAKALGKALANYRATHAGQLSGAGQAATITLGQALADFKAYVKRLERKVINPTYDEGSADLKAIFPQGRPALTKAAQTEVEDAFAAFLDALDARPTVFTSPLRTEGRGLLEVLSEALKRTDGAAKTTDTQRLDLHDGREATCLALFRAYLALLLEYAEQPRRAAAYFDFSNADTGGGKKAKLPAA